LQGREKDVVALHGCGVKGFVWGRPGYWILID
jgi:hypothetical protein